MYKKGIRILAVDDGPLDKSGKGVLVVGIVGREGTIEGVLSFRVDADGSDATERLSATIQKTRFRDQIKLIALNGVTLAGLNFIDFSQLYKRFHIPIIAVTRTKPHPNLLRTAIRKRGTQKKEKLEMLDSILKSVKIKKMKDFYVQSIGLEEEGVSRILQKATEFLRMAHMIARGIETGESKGRV